MRRNSGDKWLIWSDLGEHRRSCAHSLLTRSRKWSWLKAWGVRVAQRRGMRRAIVAVARRLAVVRHRMWVDGSEFRWRKDGAAVPAVA
jgi:transposase